jgi:hypothetical protein
MPLIEDPPPLEKYERGSWGPEAAIKRTISPYKWYLPDGKD